MKFILLAATLFSGTAFGLEKKDFTGKFNLVSTGKGQCPSTLDVKLAEFSNQTSSPSLSFTCNGDESEGCSRVIYQLADLNSGNLKRFIENPMTGQIDSVYYSHQALGGNQIRAYNRMARLNGELLWVTTFSAELIGNQLGYVFTERNKLVNTERNDICVFNRAE